jgi:hypothetical protein
MYSDGLQSIAVQTGVRKASTATRDYYGCASLHEYAEVRSGAHSGNPGGWRTAGNRCRSTFCRMYRPDHLEGADCRA